MEKYGVVKITGDEIEVLRLFDEKEAALAEYEVCRKMPCHAGRSICVILADFDEAGRLKKRQFRLC